MPLEFGDIIEIGNGFSCRVSRVMEAVARGVFFISSRRRAAIQIVPLLRNPADRIATSFKMLQAEGDEPFHFVTIRKRKLLLHCEVTFDTRTFLYRTRSD
ncbi:MAG TPA: hypothetical protein VKR29_07905 [Candidatus Binataceae bacterium]|nr:hypothetical protein [Candidatus Binataceae bacterium]